VKLPVRLRSAAEKDVVLCASFLREKNTEVAIHFLDALDGAFKILENSPGIGGTCHFKNPLFDGIRVWSVTGFKNYLIFYRLLTDEIEVVRILHGARDLESIFGEDELRPRR